MGVFLEDGRVCMRVWGNIFFFIFDLVLELVTFLLDGVILFGVVR